MSRAAIKAASDLRKTCWERWRAGSGCYRVFVNEMVYCSLIVGSPRSCPRHLPGFGVDLGRKWVAAEVTRG